MKVLNLSCGAAHVFEGWFASEEAFQDQLGRGLVECPLCGDTTIVKQLTAPRLNLGAAAPRESAQPESTQAVMVTADAKAQAAWLAMVREVLAQTDDVGERFVDEARRMHYGETPARGIRGQASREDTEALLDEGIVVLPLPIPKALKGPMQ